MRSKTHISTYHKILRPKTALQCVYNVTIISANKSEKCEGISFGTWIEGKG